MHLEFLNGGFHVVTEGGERRELADLLQDFAKGRVLYTDDPVFGVLRGLVFDVLKFSREPARLVGSGAAGPNNKA